MYEARTGPEGMASVAARLGQENPDRARRLRKPDAAGRGSRLRAAIGQRRRSPATLFRAKSLRIVNGATTTGSGPKEQARHDTFAAGRHGGRPWVAAHAGDPAIRVVEVDVSRVAYDQGHIPGATHWDAYVDLRDAAYQPVQPLELQQLLSRSGITPETTIVFYGYAAQLGFWLAKAHGHRDVRLLIGPREQWTAAGQRWTAEPPRLEESAYPLPIVDADVLASRDTVESAIGRPGQLIRRRALAGRVGGRVGQASQIPPSPPRDPLGIWKRYRAAPLVTPSPRQRKAATPIAMSSKPAISQGRGSM